MLGAIAGDVIGSVYEGSGVKTTDFPLFSNYSRFTDDTVLTVAVADAILRGGDYAESLRDWGTRYPLCGYGGYFHAWLLSAGSGPYHSWGNGAAMRVSPVGWAYDSAEQVLQEAGRSARVTHDHPEGVKGAQATALAVFLARAGESKSCICGELERRFGYDLQRSVDQIRPTYQFDLSCGGSVPESLIAFLESGCFEEAVRKAVSLGGDADTMAAIAGAVSEAYYQGIGEELTAEVMSRLSHEMKEVVRDFGNRFMSYERETGDVER